MPNPVCGLKSDRFMGRQEIGLRYYNEIQKAPASSRPLSVVGDAMNFEDVFKKFDMK